MLLLAVNSVNVIGRIMKSGETSPAMQWPMWIIYSIMLLGFFGGTLRAVQQAVIHIRSFNEKTLSTVEQTQQDAAAEAEAGRRAEGGKA